MPNLNEDNIFPVYKIFHLSTRKHNKIYKTAISTGLYFFFSGLGICVSIRMKNLCNEKENGVPKPRISVTPAIWLDCSIPPCRNSHVTANVSTRQQNASLQQLIYNTAWVQRQHIWKQVCSSVYQLYRRTGNKRSVKENENQYKENCFTSRKTLPCGRRKHGMAYRWDLRSVGERSLFYLTEII